MGFHSNLEMWQNKPVADWTEEEDEGPLSGDTGYRLRLDWEDEGTWTDRFAQFLQQPGVEAVTTLVVGAWGLIVDGEEGPDAVVQAIVSARERLPNLRALFIGDITGEESEVSWIAQTDLSPLLTAFPALEHLAARGGQGLSLGIPKHDRLKSLALEAGGLPASVVEEVSAGQLPALEYLELYLGTDNYGGDSSVEDLHTIFQYGPEKWPHLTYLGLRDCEYADALAQAITADGGVPILKHVQVLDLSLGTLGDDGVKALAACPAVAKLRKLDIHHHYASEESVALLTALGIEVDAGDPQDESKYGRFVAVSE